MLMDKEIIIFHDFNKERKEDKIKSEGDIIISDYNFNFCYDIDNFINNYFNKIPITSRCFSLIYNFQNKHFYINNNLGQQKFIKIIL